ncbi:hypothetical protein [Streptomyces sp. NPDC005953]|uniref:hypothetical protein n=1 Tax=Streptomyces sp. NPDC005953 TaxID=3156719 RepID=UPI0033C8A759
MDPAQFDGYVRRGPVDTLSIADASRQLDVIARHVNQARDDLAQREGSALTHYRKNDPTGVDSVGGTQRTAGAPAQWAPAVGCYARKTTA